MLDLGLVRTQEEWEAVPPKKHPTPVASLVCNERQKRATEAFWIDNATPTVVETINSSFIGWEPPSMEWVAQYDVPSLFSYKSKCSHFTCEPFSERF